MRMKASVQRVLPPRSSLTARSSTVTDAPCSAAETAAERPAIPQPATTIFIASAIYAASFSTVSDPEVMP